MRARLVEIAAGLVLGLALMGASAGATLVMGRLIDVGAGARLVVPARPGSPRSGEAAR